jgi:spore coat polysaccharide biosynthesis protein SpsF
LILGILQARVSSKRLPGKVLKPVLGIPMIFLEIERIRRAKKIDKLIIATSTDSTDELLEKLCRERDVQCFRGDLNDVLNRFYEVAKNETAKHIVRITGDCPLIDPSVIDRVIDFYLQGDFDYVSNAIEPTFPDGLDTEVFRYTCLKQAWQEATLPSEREHVTPFIYSNPTRFKIGHYKNARDLSHLRWTVDEELDFQLVEIIYNSLYQKNPEFSTQDILDLLKTHPELMYYNTDIKRNEGYKKSLEDNIELTK